MTVPRMLRDRILNPQGSEPIVCGSIAQLARKPEYDADEAFEILALAFGAETRDQVLLAVADGLIDIMTRARSPETLVTRMRRMVSPRSERNAWLLARIVAAREAPRAARLAALELLAAYPDFELSGESLDEIEALLAQRAGDESEDLVIRGRISMTFGADREMRPHLSAAVSPRADGAAVP
jgi:hypothetical protein